MQQYLWVRSDDSMTAGEAGVLTVHLRKAAGLLDADVFDKSDAYAVIHFVFIILLAQRHVRTESTHSVTGR